MAKLTRKSYKRRKIIMGVTLFGAVGLISTGFAAWVLSASAETTQDGSLSVGTVTDTNMVFEDVAIGTVDHPDDGINTFLFEPKSTDSSGRVRYDGANAERLSLQVTGKLLHAENLGLLKVNLAHTDKTVPEETEPENIPATPNSNGWTTDLDEAVSKGYIVLPEAYQTDKIIYKESDTAAVSSLASYSYDEETTTATFGYTVTFAWGAFFNGTNPSDFFDSDLEGTVHVDPSDSTSAFKKGTEFTDAEVAEILVDLHDLLDHVKMTLTITADPN